MVNSEYGKIFMVLGVIVGVFGIILAFSIVLLGLLFFNLAIYGAVGLFTLGLIIYFVGDTPFNCITCGHKLSTDSYYCPNCLARKPKYYHQKVHCPRCFRKTRYNKYGGRCKYCGSPLQLE